ncbi:MAG: type II toxin-antitoxin system RelE/ParE family toxin [Propionibacteriaceae bacterium]|jgi:mRNA interferase RelE/StbE|nr:type II toxin-antitoxin system RelE/ParE family toxin [Propionibacteriaceae bacterium]
MSTVQLTKDALNDLRQLDGRARQLVVKALKKLETEPNKRGAPLGSRATGNLTGFRKLVVGDRDYRIIYQVEPDETVTVIWVIARRSDDECYTLAVSRLQALPDQRLANLGQQLLDIGFGRTTR